MWKIEIFIGKSKLLVTNIRIEETRDFKEMPQAKFEFPFFIAMFASTYL